jgi:hypothetical protein
MIPNGYPLVKGSGLTLDIRRPTIGVMSTSEEKRRHSAAVILRFEPEQLDMIDQAANHAGLNRSAWLRSTVLRAAREEMGEGGGSRGKARKPSP